MNQDAIDYARSQADGADNIAPTTMQGQQAWQYAQSDNFFSPEERAAVLQKQLEPYRDEIQTKLTQIGYSPERLSMYPQVAEALYSGQQTSLMSVWIADNTQISGRLRIVMTDSGPDIRITPVEQSLTIPDQVQGVKLSKAEKQELREEGAITRPVWILDKGEYVPTFVRVDQQTNTLELWQLKPEQLPTKLMGIDLNRDQQLQLIGGHQIRLSGLIDNQGEPFNATVSVSAVRRSLEFTDLSRRDVAILPDGEYRQQLAQNNQGAKTDLVQSREQAIGTPLITNRQSEDVGSLVASGQNEEQRPIKLHR